MPRKTYYLIVQKKDDVCGTNAHISEDGETVLCGQKPSKKGWKYVEVKNMRAVRMVCARCLEVI